MITRGAGLALLLAAASAAAQTPTAVILGVVADTNLRAVGGADVSFAGSGVHVSTDSLGRFRVVRVPAGRFLMIARGIGYRPATSAVDVADGDTLRLAFTLEPATAQELATVLITERKLSNKLMEFDQRRRLGFGEFFTQADIEKINPIGMADVLRRTKAVRINGDRAHSARETGPCPMAIYIDGIPIGTEVLTYLPSPNEIAAIEVYAGSASIPVWLPKPPVNPRGQSLSAQLGCGAILLWTRDGS
jgi:hypothetical protein